MYMYVHYILKFNLINKLKKKIKFKKKKMSIILGHGPEKT